MKPPRKSLPCCDLLNPILKSSSLQTLTLKSFVLDPISVKKVPPCLSPRTTKTRFLGLSKRQDLTSNATTCEPVSLEYICSPVQLSKHRLNNEFIDTLLHNSSKQPKPTLSSSSSVPISQNFVQERSFSSSSSKFSLSNASLHNEPIVCTHFSSLSRRPSPKFRTLLDSIQGRVIQRREFSSDDANPRDGVPNFYTTRSPLQSSVPIDAGSSIRKPISLWPGVYHSPVTNALWEARSRIFEKSADSGIDGSLQDDELVAKPPSKSRTSVLYKFSSDFILREQYRNPWNEIRMGKLLEDLDALAGTISFKHCCNDDGTTRPLMLVTASVDRMVLAKPIRIDADVNIVGAVTWVGRSSMEIQLEVTQRTEGTSDPSDSLALVANFTFVARDSRTGKSTPINQVSPETEQEKLLWKEADERNKMRKKKKAESKSDSENKDVERLNALLAEGRVFCDMPALADRDSILIEDTCHENSLICQPQQRNIYGRIFGGFLMRKAFALAFSNAYAFAGAAPRFVEVDHVDFFKPIGNFVHVDTPEKGTTMHIVDYKIQVDVGNFLRLKSCVLYTERENPARPLINVEVIAHVTKPEKRSSEVSNKFYFTFTIRTEAITDGFRIRNVVPATEEEARRVIERMDAESCLIAKT